MIAVHPQHRIRIRTLQATIWRNLGKDHNWCSVKISRGFKADDGWHNNDNLGFDDLHAANPKSFQNRKPAPPPTIEAS